MYELVLVLVPPGEPGPLSRSYELITPYLRDGELSADTYSETFGNEDPDEDRPPYWDSARVGWRVDGRLWWVGQMREASH